MDRLFGVVVGMMNWLGACLVLYFSLPFFIHILLTFQGIHVLRALDKKGRKNQARTNQGHPYKPSPGSSPGQASPRSCTQPHLLEQSLIFSFLAIILGGLLACTKPSEKDSQQSLTIFAAASLNEVLSEMAEVFEAKYSVGVRMNIGSSGTLARQIHQGGMPDVYVSASKEWADYVDSLGYFYEGIRSNVAQNSLVLIAHDELTLSISKIDSTLDLAALLGSQRLSMGDPAHVPAGRYARQVLRYYGWEKELAGQILPGKDVRAALMMVELGEAPLGIVYRTDAHKSEKVQILAEVPLQAHQAIVYVAGLCSDNDLAMAFFDFLQSEDSRHIWEKYGFQQQSRSS